VNIVHNNREKTMLSLIKTLLDGASARASTSSTAASPIWKPAR
jgi:hypothetical protein